MDTSEQTIVAELSELGVPLCAALTEYVEQERLRRERFRHEFAAAAQRAGLLPDWIVPGK